jgi:prepilin-type N-terminal cleavage/methylation domain-containing protein
MRFGSTGLRAGSRPLRSTDGRVPAGDSGFTLLETLTALAILGIALVALFDAHQRGLRAARIADDYATARILAQSLLADATGGNVGGVIPRQGNEGRFGWAIEVQPAGGGWADIKSDANWRLNHVRVTVAWDADRRVQLDTLKLGRAK